MLPYWPYAAENCGLHNPPSLTYNCFLTVTLHLSCGYGHNNRDQCKSQSLNLQFAFKLWKYLLRNQNAVYSIQLFKQFPVLVLSSVDQYTYSMIIFDAEISSTINKKLYSTPLTFFNCNVQGSPLIKKMKQIHLHTSGIKLSNKRKACRNEHLPTRLWDACCYITAPLLVFEYNFMHKRVNSCLVNT